MSVDPSKSGFSYLSSQLPKGLFLEVNEGLSDFLICHGSNGKFAVALNGRAPFRAIELGSVNIAWRGCIIEEIQLLVDERSWFTSHTRDPRPGDIVLTESKVWLAAEGSFGTGCRLVEWGSASTVGEGELMGGFSSWTVVQQRGNEARELKSISSGRATVEITD